MMNTTNNVMCTVTNVLTNTFYLIQPICSEFDNIGVKKKYIKKKFISFFTLIRLNLVSCFGISNDFIMEQFFMSTMIKSIDLHIHTHNQCTIMIKSVRILRNFELFFFWKYSKKQKMSFSTHIYIYEIQQKIIVITIKKRWNQPHIMSVAWWWLSMAFFFLLFFQIFPLYSFPCLQ